MTQYVSDGPLTCVRHPPERRRVDGTLINPPKLFLVSYSEETDQYSLEPIEWAIARVLSPDAVGRIGEKLAELRDVERAESALALTG
jgi:hypothetical protein